MNKLHQDGIHLLQGMTVALAVLGAVVTIGGLLLSVTLSFAPGEVIHALRGKMGRTLDGVLLSAAIVQTLGWAWLPRIQFVPQRIGRGMAVIMGAIALFMFATVLFSL